MSEDSPTHGKGKAISDATSRSMLSKLSIGIIIRAVT